MPRFDAKKAGLKLAALTAFAGVGAGAGYVGIHYYRDHERLRDTRITVADKKDGIITGDFGSSYVVEDAQQHQAFNAAATYQKMHIGCTYNVTIYGTRVHQLTGILPNVVRADLKPDEKCPAPERKV